MNQVWIPEGYESCLGLYDTQKAIGLIKNLFQQKLCLALHLKRVTAPLFVTPSSGLNDDLNGVERPVGFDIPAVDGGGGEGSAGGALAGKVEAHGALPLRLLSGQRPAHRHERYPP